MDCETERKAIKLTQRGSTERGKALQALQKCRVLNEERAKTQEVK